MKGSKLDDNKYKTCSFLTIRCFIYLFYFAVGHLWRGNEGGIGCKYGGWRDGGREDGGRGIGCKYGGWRDGGREDGGRGIGCKYGGWRDGGREDGGRGIGCKYGGWRDGEGRMEEGE